jgi:hypothetical protein
MLCCKAVYGGRLWRPVLILEFARSVQQSLGTSALILSYVFVLLYIDRDNNNNNTGILRSWHPAGAECRPM